MDAWEPTVAVDQSTGHVTMAWYDRRDSTDPTALNYLYRTYYTQSTDGGSTFLPQQIAVSTRQSDPTADCNGTGDYMQMIAVDGVAHPFWADTRNIVNGNHIDQIFTAPVQDSSPINNWVQRGPFSTLPAGRWLGSVDYDSAHGNVVLFGGANQGTCSAVFSDTWTWDGTSWTLQHPVNSPDGRGGGAMAYDAATSRSILFGGQSVSCSSTLPSDTWSWDGNNWTKLTPKHHPSGRAYATMSYDAATGSLVLFGGQDSSGTLLNDTWIWNGTDWTQPRISNPPPARAQAASAYDALHGVVVLFGGNGTSNPNLNDTWTWNGTNWTNTMASNPPHGRTAVRMDFDTFLGKTVLFGGSYYLGGTTTYLNDTWTWDGSTWAQMTPGNSPVPRASVQLAYMANTRLIVLFGGVSPAPGGYLTAQQDTWTY